MDAFFVLLHLYCRFVRDAGTVGYTSIPTFVYRSSFPPVERNSVVVVAGIYALRECEGLGNVVMHQGRHSPVL